MSTSLQYGRVLLKLSGNALADDKGTGFSQQQVLHITGEIEAVLRKGCSLAIVLGAGNILRGASYQDSARLKADLAGMVATMVNGLVLQQALNEREVPTYICSALPIAGCIDPFNDERCRKELKNGKILILAGGTGNPLFTTDTAAVLRAIQLKMDLILKATRVDGVYSEDPETSNSPEFISNLTYDEVLNGNLGIMDLCAIQLCKEHNMPVRVFNFKKQGNLQRAVCGGSTGSLICGE